jgi:hypothetical protein
MLSRDLLVFNPVVANWTPECQAAELNAREDCDFCLYVITPKMTGFYSIAEVVDDSNKRPGKTIFCYLDELENDNSVFTPHQIKSLKATANMVMLNGAQIFNNLDEVADYLNEAQYEL